MRISNTGSRGKQSERPGGGAIPLMVTIFGLLTLALALLLLVALAGCVLGVAVAVVGIVLSVAVLVLTVRSIRRWRRR